MGDNMIPMFAYIRVSTQEQADSRLGIEAQEAALTAEAARRGWELTIYRDEGASGKNVNPGLRSALDQLAAGNAAGLVVTKLDRLARSVSHASDIIERAQSQGWNLVMLDLGIDLATPSGEAMAHMLATFAQLERRLIGERTKAALAAKKAQGATLGRPRLVTEPIAQRIVGMREQGLSYAAIASELTAAGELSPAGRPTWQASTVRRICNSIEQAKEVA
ncbi:recombinase family protein [Gordonia polyisoprenivorans]|nr:recombinase family protein [Gordonia polyisoprenivorans]